MNNNDLKILSESLINTFNFAGKESIRLYKEGLKIEIKKDKTPVSNGDIKVRVIELPGGAQSHGWESLHPGGLLPALFILPLFKQ